VRMADREAGSSGKDADNALKDMYVTLGRMVPCMENQQNNNLNHRGFNHDLEGQGKSEMLKNFMNMHPPDFVGEGDPDKAESLIMNMERTFKTMGRNDEMKLLLATLRLENDAARRWKMIDSKWIAAQTVRMADREAGSSGKDADNALKDMYVILGRMVSCMENKQNNNLNHRGFNHDLEGQGKSEMLKNFMNMHPPDFVGEGDPDKAENLIMNMERTFKTMGRNDEMKLLLATLRLENDAARRWKMIDSKWIAAQTVRTWELFKTEFNKNYIPRSVKPKREAEFRNFEQGNLTAQQYATKFTSLARHASYLVEGADMRFRKFQDGLKPEIQEKISIRNVDDYYEMVDRALLIEKSDGDIKTQSARLSGTRPNASKWQVGRNLNTCGNKVQRAGVRMADREACFSGKYADTALKDMYVILGRIVSCMENQQNNNLNHRGFNHDLERQGKSEMLKNFMNMHPPDFVGEGDPAKAENLIMNLERTFKTMGRNDEMKLLLATLRLENDAARRWKMIDSKWIAAQTVRTWELFKIEFNKNYIPRSVKPKREAEFRNFELGNLTAQQYATKFTSLARHASYLVEGEDMRFRKFQDGLKPEIQEKISIRNVDDYYEMVDRALLIEKNDGYIPSKRARSSGTRPNASKWQVGRNLNTCDTRQHQEVVGEEYFEYPFVPENQGYYELLTEKHVFRGKTPTTL
ncbi:hypothetical protein RJ640_023706, partial [Escallonia rubra]